MISYLVGSSSPIKWSGSGYNDMFNVQILLSEMTTTAEMNSVWGKYYSCDGPVVLMLVLISAISFFYFLSEVIAAIVHWSQVSIYDHCRQKNFKAEIQRIVKWRHGSCDLKHLTWKLKVVSVVPTKRVTETVVDIPQRSFIPKSSGRNV